MLRIPLALALVSITASCAGACWADIDPAAFADDCPLIVRGRIVSVTEAAPGQLRADDLAEIRVTEVLRNELKDVPLKVGDTITVRMISRRNTQRSSTDLNYPVRTEATWLILLTTKGEYRIDRHPVQKQPVDSKLKQGFGREEKVTRRAREPKSPNPLGTMTREEWITRQCRQAARQAEHRAEQEATAREIRTIARGLAGAEKLEKDAVTRFRKAPQEVRRDLFQLRDNDQPMTGDRLVDMVEFVLKSEPDENVRVFAASCLGYSENKDRAGKRAGAVLAQALTDRSASVRMFACQTLWQRGETRQAVPVVRLLRDGNAEVRTMAATTLVRLGDIGQAERKSAVPVLMERLVPELLRVTALLKKGTRDSGYDDVCRLLDRYTGMKNGDDPLAWLGWWEKAHSDHSAPALKADRAAARTAIEEYRRLIRATTK